MPSATKDPSPQFGQYTLIVLGLAIATILVKILVTWAAERYMAPIPWLGGMLQTLELPELINIPVFAILGVGLGASSRYLPTTWPATLKGVILLVMVPLVFSSSYLMRQHLWVTQVANQGNLTYGEAQELTNQLLQAQTGNSGFLGFFSYTTHTPILPTNVLNVEQLGEEDRWFRSELTRFSGIEPGLFSLVFDGVGWGIRILYMLLTGVTALIYFVKGLAWAQANPPLKL